MKIFFKSYVYLPLFAILSAAATAQSANQHVITLNYKNILSYYKAESFKTQEIENNLNTQALVFEQLNLKYKLNTSLDLSKQVDQTDLASTFLQQNTDTNKYSWLLSKRFLSGTNLGLELTHLDNAVGTLPALADRSFANQNYFAVSIDQPLFPNFLGSKERALYNSAETVYEIQKIQNTFDLLGGQKEVLQLFWKTKALAKSIEENTKIIVEYEKLIQKVQQKKKNQFASAGELEQALSETETRRMSLKQDTIQLSKALLELKSILNFPTETEIKFDQALPRVQAPQILTTKVTELKKYRLQQLKLKTAEDSAVSVDNSNLPQLSIYGKYTQSGLDTSNSTAVDEAKDPNYKKYLIGLKLDYTFDNNKFDLEQKVKLMSLSIEKNKTSRSLQELTQEIELSHKALLQSFNNMTSHQKILDYRKKAVAEISKNYFQGRTDISFLIDAYNKKNAAEINLIISFGEYETSKIDYEMLTL